MFKPIPAFNWSTTIFVVLIVQLITVFMLVTNLLTSNSGAIGSIAQLPPINFLYSGGDLSWIGAGRAICHIIIALMDIVIGTFCVWYGAVRKLRVNQFLTIVLGVYFFSSAAMNISLAGGISSGGWWHIAGLISAIVASLAATASAVTFALVFSNIVHTGTQEDQ